MAWRPERFPHRVVEDESPASGQDCWSPGEAGLSPAGSEGQRIPQGPPQHQVVRRQDLDVDAARVGAVGEEAAVHVEDEGVGEVADGRGWRSQMQRRTGRAAERLSRPGPDAGPAGGRGLRARRAQCRRGRGAGGRPRRRSGRTRLRRPRRRRPARPGADRYHPAAEAGEPGGQLGVGAVEQTGPPTRRQPAPTASSKRRRASPMPTTPWRNVSPARTVPVATNPSSRPGSSGTGIVPGGGGRQHRFIPAAASAGSATQMTLPSSMENWITLPTGCPFELVGVQQTVAGSAPEHDVELPGQVVGVPQPAAQTLAGEGRHQVGGVTGQ